MVCPSSCNNESYFCSSFLPSDTWVKYASEELIIARHQISHQPRLAPKLFKMLEKYLHKTDQSNKSNTHPAVLRQLGGNILQLHTNNYFSHWVVSENLEKLNVVSYHQPTEWKASPWALGISKQNTKPNRITEQTQTSGNHCLSNKQWLAPCKFWGQGGGRVGGS